MKNKKIMRICFIMSFGLLLFTTACKNKVVEQPEVKSSITNTQEIELDDNTASENINDTQSSEIQNSILNTDEPSKNKGKVESIERAATKEISIYTMNETTLEVEVVAALVPADSEVTPESIVDMVVDSLADRLVIVGIDEVTTKDDTVIVSFLSDKAPLANVGSGVEETILNSFAQSLVDNLEDYPKVIFRVEGNAYSSGHFEFGIDQVYLDNEGTN